jgi:predicted RNase H-like HicB family nuclease
MKMYDVIVERNNGVYRASVPTLPNLSVEGATCDEAVANAKTAIEEFFKSAEVTTVSVDVPADEFRPYTRPSDLLRWTALYSRPATPLDEEFEAELAAEKQRQREEAELEFELAESEYPHAERWLRAAKITKEDPNDPLYQEFLAGLAAEKQHQREEAEREAETEECEIATMDFERVPNLVLEDWTK